MKKYSSLIEQYKTQDEKRNLLDEQNDSLQSANCLDDEDCGFGTALDCTSDTCNFSQGACEGLGSSDCLDCNDKY